MHKISEKYKLNSICYHNCVYSLKNKEMKGMKRKNCIFYCLKIADLPEDVISKQNVS